jgi:DNA polymerase III delta prime subunit
MVYKNKTKQNEYMKNLMRNKRELGYNKRKYQDVINEIHLRCILPRHIYSLRQVLKQMLKEYFKQKIIKIRNKTELIQSYYL